jgi:hypothetical protein
MDRWGFRILASMPYGTYGGPLVTPEAPPGTREALLTRFFEIAGEPRVAFAELVDYAGSADDLELGTRSYDDGTHLLDLTGGYRAVWEGYRSTCRNRIRKVQSEGIVARRARTLQEFRDYHPLLAATCRRNRAPVLFDVRFLEGLWALQHPGVRLWLAHDETGPLAGHLDFSHRGTVLNWGLVSRDDAGKLAVHNLLHDAAIREAIDEGDAIYNFGSSLGFEGLVRFKETFGAVPRPYRHRVAEKPWFPKLRRWSRALG